MPRPYGGVCFDLFGTLVRFEVGRLPHLVRDGVRVPTTIAGLRDQLAEAAPGVAPAVFWDALVTVSGEMAVERCDHHRELPSRERFRRALERVGVEGDAASEGGVVLSRAHLAQLVAATEYPASHRGVFEQARRLGRVAVVSNFDDTAAAYEILQRHGILDGLDGVVVSETIGFRKPHPLMMRFALAGLDLPAEAVLFVGDTFADDVVGAQAVGLDVAWIDRDGRGVPLGAVPPTYVVRRLEEVAAVLAA
jgi:FMN phosphatase YigB (HAD superfamily)